MSNKVMLSIDVEDWFCVTNMIGTVGSDDWRIQEQRIHIGMTYLLEQLRQHQIRATFFVLGWIADHHPRIVQDILNDGHELGTHGYSHTPIHRLTPSAFEADLARSIEAIERCSGVNVQAFRAPCFSITDQTLWALDILDRLGFRYDSSIFPTRHPEYGIPRFGTAIRKVNMIWEVPLSSISRYGMQIPLAGGGYFRLFPYSLTRSLIQQAQKSGPVVLYFHPWEFDPEQPRMDLSRIKTWRHYQGLQSSRAKFERLLNDFQFCAIEDHLNGMVAQANAAKI